MLGPLVVAGTVGMALVWGALAYQVGHRLTLRNTIALTIATAVAAFASALLADAPVAAVWFTVASFLSHTVWRLCHG
jgi:hypothetical protein